VNGASSPCGRRARSRPHPARAGRSRRGLLCGQLALAALYRKQLPSLAMELCRAWEVARPPSWSGDSIGPHTRRTKHGAKNAANNQPTSTRCDASRMMALRLSVVSAMIRDEHDGLPATRSTREEEWSVWWMAQMRR
jgi:hypothetical protein